MQNKRKIKLPEVPGSKDLEILADLILNDKWNLMQENKTPNDSETALSKNDFPAPKK